MIDFHSHILPGADHGSPDLSVTARQLEMMHAGGTRRVVMTPHFYPSAEHVADFLARRTATARALTKLPPPADMTLHLGAEVLLCPDLEEMEGLSRLAVVGTRVILLEMPFRRFDNRLIETVLAIRDSGLTPVLAHIDRYRREDIDLLLSEGVLAQLNADGLSTPLRYIRNRRYLSGDQVVALGSDLHGAEKGGYRAYLAARRRLGARAEEIDRRAEVLLAGALPLSEALAVEEKTPLTV